MPSFVPMDSCFPFTAGSGLIIPAVNALPRTTASKPMPARGSTVMRELTAEGDSMRTRLHPATKARTVAATVLRLVKVTVSGCSGARTEGEGMMRGMLIGSTGREEGEG